MLETKKIAFFTLFSLLMPVLVFGSFLLSAYENVNIDQPATTERASTDVRLSQTALTLHRTPPAQTPWGALVSPGPPCVPAPGWYPYTILNQDSLTKLSLASNLDEMQLLVANCMSADDFKPGKTIFLPVMNILLAPAPTGNPQESLKEPPAGSRTSTQIQIIPVMTIKP